MEGNVQAESKVQLKQLNARCEQPDNKNTRNSKLYFTGTRLVALFTGGRRSAMRYNNGDDDYRQHPWILGARRTLSLSLTGSRDGNGGKSKSRKVRGLGAF